MLKLERIENEVYCEGKKLTIVPQSTKGPNMEVVKIEGLPGSNGQKWVSLRKLHEGINEIECQGKEVTTHKKYQLTEEEQNEINTLQSRIDEIIENAKRRYVEKPNLNLDPSKLTLEERLAEVEKLKAYYGL